MTIDGALFRDNRAPSLVYWGGFGNFVLTRTLFCNNSSPEGVERSEAAVDLGSVSGTNGDRALIANNRFIGNEAALRVRPFSPTPVTETLVHVIHNHFLGNTGDRAAVLAVPASGRERQVRFANNVVAFNAERSPDVLAPLIEAGRVSHNVWWDNQPLLPLDRDGAPVLDDPVIRTPSGDCLLGAASRPIGRPDFYGSTVDAGVAIDVLPIHPDGAVDAKDFVDRDGSPPDIGAWGGPYALASEWADDDDDGVPLVYDCAPDDDSVGAGLSDAPYDGIDADCRFDDDLDADSDGHRPPEHGGEDCDDTLAARAPDAPEIPGNGLDDDCDGLVDEEVTLRPVSCAHLPSGTPTPLALALMGLLALRGRQRDGSPDLRRGSSLMQ